MPTKKQKKIVEVLEKKRGTKSIRSLMLEAGYKPNTAKNPKNLTESKGFQEQLRELLPEKEVLKAHSGLLKASVIQHHNFPMIEKNELIKRIIKQAGCEIISIKAIKVIKARIAYYFAPDNKSRKEAIDMYYKLTGRYAAQEVKIGRLDDLTDEELDEILAGEKELEDRYKKFKEKDKK